jgi:hypothetical protein
MRWIGPTSVSEADFEAVDNTQLRLHALPTSPRSIFKLGLLVDEVAAR